MVLLGDVGRVEARFGTFGDNVSLGTKRWTVGAVCCIGLEVVLDALDGTPRWRWSSGSTFWYIW